MYIYVYIYICTYVYTRILELATIITFNTRDVGKRCIHQGEGIHFPS